MADQWFFEWDDKDFGPFSATQLKELAALGRLQPSDAVWKEDRKKGVRADRIKNLFANPVEQLQEQVPSVIPDQDASAFSVAAFSVLSPDSDEGQEPALETSAILATVTDPKPADAVSRHGQAEPPKKHVRKGRARAVTGVVIISQNGDIVQYKKKCGTCGFEEASRRTMPIRPGITKDTLFCPKCSKRVEVAIQGTSS